MDFDTKWDQFVRDTNAPFKLWNISTVTQDQKPLSEFFIFGDEWANREAQVRGFVTATTGKFDRVVHGRKTQVKEVAAHVGREFIERYHVQGHNRLGIVFFGLYDGSELVGVMSLGRHHRPSGNLVVLDRLCFKAGVHVQGGASKLFARCRDWATARNYDQILSFSDNRLTAGKVYERLGFELEKNHRSDYCYVGLNGRVSKQSQKKSSAKCPPGMTELAWAIQRGLIRIWDSGKKRWVFPLKGATWKQELSRRCATQHANGVFKHAHIRGYFQSAKNNCEVYYGSSYELRCLYLLEIDTCVKSFQRCEAVQINGRWRNPDILVVFVAGRTAVFEVKPLAMLDNEAVKLQINDSQQFCTESGHDLRVWTETDSGLAGEKEIVKWAKGFLRDRGDTEYADRRKKLDRNKANRHYHAKIATDTVEVFCDYCQTTHTALRKTHDANLARNGTYICERQGGAIAGRKPGVKKVNPHAAEGKKECLLCKQVLFLEEFGKDKAKPDGHASRCMKCRAGLATAKYQAKLK